MEIAEAMKQAETVIMPLDILIEPEYNPNEEDEETYQKLLKLIKKYGYLEYIVVNKRTNYTIVSGSHRKRALIELGWTKAPVIVIDVDLVDEMTLNLAFNNLEGMTNEEKLEKVVFEINELDSTNLELTGLDQFELDMMEVNLNNSEDPFKDEFDPEDLKYKTENEEKRGSAKPKKESKPKLERQPEKVECPFCNEDITEFIEVALKNEN